MLVGLALFLSLFVMRPVIDEIDAQAYTPYGSGQITIEEAVSRSGTVLHGFMIRQTRETDLQMFAESGRRRALPEPAGRALLDPAARLRHLRAEDRLPDRLPDLPALPDHRPRRLVDPDVAGHDDAVADHRLDAVQAAAVRPGRRLGADDGLARRLLLAEGSEWTAIIFIGVAQQALWILALASAPILIPALIAGLILGMIQAATSINEQTLTFVPKLIVVAVCLAIFGGSIMVLIADFTPDMFDIVIPEIGR